MQSQSVRVVDGERSPLNGTLASEIDVRLAAGVVKQFVKCAAKVAIGAGVDVGITTRKGEGQPPRPRHEFFTDRIEIIDHHHHHHRHPHRQRDGKDIAVRRQQVFVSEKEHERIRPIRSHLQLVALKSEQRQREIINSDQCRQENAEQQQIGMVLEPDDCLRQTLERKRDRDKFNLYKNDSLKKPHACILCRQSKRQCFSWVLCKERR